MIENQNIKSHIVDFLTRCEPENLGTIVIPALGVFRPMVFEEKLNPFETFSNYQEIRFYPKNGLNGLEWGEVEFAGKRYDVKEFLTTKSQP